MTKHILCHSYKGGVGTTTVACSIALIASQDDTKVLLVDCSPQRDTLSWLGFPHKGCGLHESVLPNLDLAILDEVGYSFAEATGQTDEYDLVVIDAGTTNYRLHAEDTTQVLVVRNDYMALRNATLNKTSNNAVVLVEPNRVLTKSDCKQVLGAENTVFVEWDEAVSRAIDAGVMPTRARELVGEWVAQLTAPIAI